MNKEFELFHGSALCRIIHHEDVNSIKLYSTKSNSSYIVNDNIGLFIKYSAKRMSPWHFTFKKDHQDEIYEMSELLDRVFLVLVCKDDGICCLSYQELKLILDEEHEEVEWVSVARRPRQKYRVGGHDGKLKFKRADNKVPNRLFLKE